MTAEDLRKSILQQAIQGKLVPQDPKDEPASELLSKIRAEKERLIKEKKIKRDKNETIIYRGEDNSYYEKILATGEVKCIDNEIPFEIPDSWEWVRFKCIADIARGGSPRPIKSYLTNDINGINWIKISDTEKGSKYINSVAEKIRTEGVIKSRLIHKGDFLLTNSMSFGRPYISNVEGCIHDGWLVISPYSKAFSQDYLFYLLSSPFAYSQFSGKVTGAVVKNLNTDKVCEAIIPIPPLNEQHSIVKKVEIILSLIDRYRTFQEQTQEIENVIKVKLQKSILQYAIQGKLVPQLDIEGTASDLLEKIQQTKLQLVKEGKLKKKDLVSSIIFRDDDNKYYEKVGKSIADITDSIPFEIPDSWLWCRLSSVADLYTGNSINETEKKNKYTNVEGVKYIATKDVQFDHSIIYNNGIAIPKQYVSEFRIAPANSVLMCIEGGSAGRKIGILSHDVCFGNKLCCFKPYADISEYIYYYLQSPLFYSIFSSNKNGIIGGVSVNNLKQLLIPMPPLSEIKRIVNKLRKSISIIES